MSDVVLCMTWKKAIIAFCRRTSLVIRDRCAKVPCVYLSPGAQLYLFWRTTVAVEEVHVLLSLIRCFIFLRMYDIIQTKSLAQKHQC